MSENLKEVLSGLKPGRVWYYFEQFCHRPRPSKHEEKVTQYLEAFAKEHSLEYKKYDVGNVLIRKPATKGLGNKKVVVLQAHIDMVPQKRKDKAHDFTKDPIEAHVEGEWVKANGTTLGADNGIGAAYALAILESNDIEHGPIETLFTVDEEAGMTGMHAVNAGELHANILLNLDTEEEGAFYVGSAGGINTDMTLDYSEEKTSESDAGYQINILGLTGGHSGIDIQKKRANAIKLLNEVLKQAGEKYGLRVSEIEGGSQQHNAIPREAHAIIAIPKDQEESLSQTIKEIELKAQDTFEEGSNIQIELKHCKTPEYVMAAQVQNQLSIIIEACPHGALDYTKEVPDLVQTSSNLASLTVKDKKITILTSQRSSVDAEMLEVSKKIEELYKQADAKIDISGRYPGWKPNFDSEILKTSKEVFEKIYKKTPEIKAIHAGLECGLLASKYPNMDMISFGPTIVGAHSPDERVEIKSVERVWNYLLKLLKDIPNKN